MSLIQDILNVLQADPVGKAVLSTKAVPQTSPQSTDLSVLASYAQHNAADLTSVAEKSYDSVRNLYVDVKTAAVQALVALPIGSEEYMEVDRFFKFAAALIIREGSRMDLFGGKDPEDVVPEDVTEFEEEIVADYADLTADLESWSAEAFLVMGQNGPLFSTLSTKSAIDPRPSITPGAFQVTNVLPRTRSVPAYQLGYLTPAVSRLPHPALPPTEMMTHFVHPNGSELAPSRFLRMDANSSFAPTSDSGKAVYDPASTGALWYEKVGRLRETAIDEALEKNGDTKKEDTNDVEMKDATEAKVEEQDEEKEKKEEEEEDLQPLFKDEDVDPSKALPMDDIIQWHPRNFIDDDEFEAIKTGTELEFVSRLMLQLQQLQADRLATPDIPPPVSFEERRLAMKIEGVLGRLLQTSEGIDIANSKIKPSTNIPALKTNYLGVLPAPEPPKPISSVGRLPSGSKTRRGKR
ncbi:Chromatin structure-remodeling complex protein [Yarrowia sp. C11]|nr:Chromatin structure-remodeling complex protein [Yarrowia sp. C11]KAG5359430.1 Chromatin structure-remodeling complex protein [Yarrowia sp. E02]